MAKKKKIVRQNTLTRKIGGLTVFLDAVFLVIILGAAVFLYYFNSNNTRIENANYQNQVVETFIQGIISEVESDVYELARDEDIINYLTYVNAGNDPTVLETDPNYNIYSSYLIQAGSVIDYQEDDLYDLSYIATDVECSSGTDGCAIAHDGQLSFSDWLLTSRPWYSGLSANDTVLTAPYVDALTGEYVISFVETIYDLGNPIGYVGIDIKLESLAKVLNAFVSENIGESDELMIVSDFYNSPKLMYISTDTNSEYVMQDIETINTLDETNGYGDYGVGFLLENSNINDLSIIKLLGGKYFVIQNTIDNTPFTTLTLYNVSRVFNIEIIVSLVVRKQITSALKPINVILGTIEQIKNGNYEARVKIKENNEFKKIGDAINIMSSEINFQIQKTYDSLAYDMLTGLKNRASATQEIDETVFKSDKRTAVCLIQVDNLKNINITKGNLIGDNLIKAIAEELRKILKTDSRLFSNGGNEFVYIKEDFTSLEQVEYTLSQMLVHFKDPIIVKNIKAEIKFYIGVSIYPTDGGSLGELINKCDTALFKASEFGNKKIIFYNEKIARSVSYQAEISERLAQAVEKGQIYLKYQ